MKRKLINIYFFCAISICCNAQVEGYRFYAPLDSIKTSGFYNIVLSPEINAHLKTDYSDVRIVNGAGKWVPHALHVPNNEISRAKLNLELKYSLIENNKINSIFIINEKYRALNNIELLIRNTAAERYCSLSGSDDNVNWFVINDSILINPTPTETKSVNVFRLNFPLNNYKFYKLIIVNSNKDPLDINKMNSSAENNEPLFIQNKVIKNPNTTIEQKDSGKISYIKVTQQHPYHFDGISLKISAVKYYVRKLDVFVPTAEKHSFSNPGNMVESFIFSNNSNLSFRIPLTNPRVFYLQINNEDNLPLKVDEVATTINEHFTNAYLEKGDMYRLIMGNQNANLPNYDIAKLNLSISDSATFIETKSVVAFPQKDTKENKKATSSKWIIWTALIAGLFILLLLTKKMIKEVDKKTNNDTL
jgi:hypothetical protein